MESPQIACVEGDGLEAKVSLSNNSKHLVNHSSGSRETGLLQTPTAETSSSYLAYFRNGGKQEKGVAHGQIRERENINEISYFLCSSNNTASATSRLGATIDVEQNHMRFLGDLMLNLWDCGGQDNFFDSYLSSQRQTIFNDVAVLIYVFDIEIETRQPTDAVLKEKEKDFEYFYHILDNCRSRSPEAKIFVLINKMDLISGGKKEKDEAYSRKVRELDTRAKPIMGDTSLRCFGTSIWDQSLYRAWSRIVHTLIPNANLLARHLSMFCSICDATEVVLFERTTFLIIARSGRSGEFGEQGGEISDSGDDPINPERFEKISELIKAFKLSCSKLQEQFHSLEMRFPQFACLLDVLTPNTYVMVVTSHPNIQPSLLKLNVRLARSKFNELQAGRFPSIPTTPTSST